jgi:8-oxo-dGTP pyrophosphatase MutT (NUDIX family)
MSAFELPKPYPKVQVKIPANVTREQLLSFIPFKNWLATLQESMKLQSKEEEHPFHKSEERYTLRQIDVHAVEYFGSRIGFVLMETIVQNEADSRPLAGIVFLRGGSVAILMILRPLGDSTDRWVIMTQQPRIPAGSLRFFEIPAGMIDDQGTFVGAAATEIREETRITVPKHELVDMTQLALKNSKNVEPHLKKAMYPSPGGCDEFIALFLWERRMSLREIKELEGKLTGNVKDREKIEVNLVKYEDLWREGARDAKTLAAWALYENLRREGSLK